MSARPEGTGESLDYVRDLPGYHPNRPQYFDSEVVDHLVGIVLEFGAELWVMRDRQAHLEELLAEQGMDARAALDRRARHWPQAATCHPIPDTARWLHTPPSEPAS